MLNKKEIKQKEKDFKTWARNDAKGLVYNNRNNESKEEYFGRLIAHYNEDRLTNTFNYSKEQAQHIINFYNTEFWRGYEYWKAKKEKIDLAMKLYDKIFQEAEEFAKTINVIDIKDGFPCGSAHLYLAPKTSPELEKLLKGKNFSSKGSMVYELKLPIKMPVYGQCISFDERICKKVKEFLAERGIDALTHSWID